MEVKELEEELKNKYFETTINKNHCLPIELGGTNMILKVLNIDLVKSGISELDNTAVKTFGLYVKETAFEFSLAKDISDIKLKGMNNTLKIWELEDLIKSLRISSVWLFLQEDTLLTI
jgi:hypothetical protein